MELFKPSVAVQARELTNIQGMLLSQISKFGQNIFVSGTIISGCTIKFNSNLSYVKLQDNYANGSPLTVSNLVGNYALSTNGLKALINNSQPGYVSQSPNLNTIYINYLNSSTNGSIKVFQNDEVLSIVTATNNLIGQIVVANTISSGNNSNTTGVAYQVSIDSGVIFQKGCFLNVNAQSIIPSPYTNYLDQISVGFNTIENIVTSYQDTTLLDNSQGSPNYSAPGADRLQLIPTLTSIPTQNNTSTNTFFSIVDFSGGQPFIVNQNTEYSVIGDKIAQISSDTNGNFIISPFNVRCITNYYANGVIDPLNVKLEIDTGTCYVDGYRLQTLTKILSVIPKGTTTNTYPSQIVTTQMGGYVTVCEYGGVFNYSSGQVSLRNAPAYAISNNAAKGTGINSVAAPGSQIGTAYVLASQYNGGTIGSNTATYDLYLYNVQMANGQSFSNTRCIVASSGSKGIADIQLTGNTFYLQDSQFTPLVYDFNQAAIKTLKNSSNTIDAQFEFIQSTNVIFSNTGYISVTIPTYTGGNNVLPYGTGSLTNPQMEQFTVVCESNSSSSNIAGVVATTGSNVIGTSTTFSTSLWPGAYIQIANSTTSEIKQVLNITNNTLLTLTVNSSYTWVTANINPYYLAGMVIPTNLSNATITIASPNTFTVNLNTIFPSTVNGSITYPIQRTLANPLKKDLQTSIYVKINCGNNVGNTSGPWCLGLPDVYQISNVWYGTTYSTSNPSITSSMTLNTNQKDQYYGLSFMKLSNSALSFSNTTLLLVEVQAFLSDSSSGVGYFSIDSYPIDDTGVTANSIMTQDIPVYTSNTVNASFNLRNCVDFRIYAQNTIPYISNATLAISNTVIVNPSNTVTFSTPSYIPVPDAEFETSTQSYNGRYDVVGFNNTGVVVINSGNPGENPVPPSNIVNGITLATIKIPPYPTLTPDSVTVGSSNSNPPISLVYTTNRRYTMSDIGTLDTRLSQVEYYTSLSLLELSAQNLLISSASGVNRFQNGMLADPFVDFSVSNTNDPEFNCAIDGAAQNLRPVFTQFLVNLVYSNTLSNDVTISNNGRLITLDDAQSGTPFISQQFSSQVRNCAEDILYTWVGNIVLNPEGDYQVDTTVNPDVVVSTDSYSNWVNLANAWGTQWGTWTETSNSVSTSTSTAAVSGGTSSTTVTSTTTNGTQTGTQLSVTAVNNDYSFGDVVTSIGLQPYCRANLIRFTATGLKPSTQFWPYLDDTPILQYCAQTDSNFNIASYYQAMTSDANGNLYGLFYMPAETFHTGSLNFQLIDVSNLTIDSNVITSVASVTYYGTNLAYTENNLDLDTTTAQLAITTVSQSTSTTANSTATTVTLTPVTNTVYVSTAAASTVSVPSSTSTVTVSANTGSTTISQSHSPGPGTGTGAGPGGSDPLAQSFTVGLSSGLQGIYINSIDLFFQTKHQTLGLTIQIREMVDGVPGASIMPFSQVHINPSQVNTSTDASVATNIQFGAPVLLYNSTQYCIVVLPDGANSGYNLYTGVIGGTDITTGSPIYSISSTGVLFLSSGNSTWTPYQNELVKFNIWSEYFTQLSGNVVFTNDGSEYLSISNVAGSFQLGENIYVGTNTYVASQNVSVSNTSLTITVANTRSYPAGAGIILQSNTNNKTFWVQANATSNTVFTLASYPPFTDANASLIYGTFIYGTLKSINSSMLVFSNSNVTNTNCLLSNDGLIVVGQSSYAVGTINTVNDIPYDTFMPKFSSSVPSVCYINYSMLGTSNSSTGYIPDSTPTALTYGQATDFIDQQRVVMSRSNEIRFISGNKSLNVTAQMLSQTQLISPALDTIKAGAVCVHNSLNSELANGQIFFSEITNDGLAINKYVSLTVNLAAGLNAEDLSVYIGAYWPAGTTIYVYGKLLNQYDGDPFDFKAWSPMYTQSTVNSSKTNINDYNEYLFQFPTSYGQPTSTSYLTTTTGYLNTAFIDSSNNNVVAYVSPEGQYYSEFDTFAIKIVLCGSTSQLPPRLSDMRAIASSSGS